ncbi:MAG: hypothetical protein ACLGIR_03585 [Actinomycetes bacterium]
MPATPSVTPPPDAAEPTPADPPRGSRSSLLAALMALALTGAIVSGVTLQRSQEQAARVEAQRADARVELARDVIAAATELVEPARQMDLDAEALRRTLEDLLLVSDRTDEELAEDRATLLAALEADAERLRALVVQPTPAVDPILDRERVEPVLDGFEGARAEATALAEEAERAVADAEAWATAVELLAARAAGYAASVSDLPGTEDPDELAELWRAEREPLEALADAADRAAAVPGLEELAGAYREYATANLAWIDEAVELLGSDRAEEYNERLDDLFGVPDPFGFNLAVSRATSGALRAPALEALTDLRRRTLQLRRDLAELDRDIATRLGGRPTG